MAELFQTTPQNITLHLRAIYEEGELAEAATCKDYLQVRIEGARQVKRSLRYSNLEAILAVGYRVRDIFALAADYQPVGSPPKPGTMPKPSMTP